MNIEFLEFMEETEMKYIDMHCDTLMLATLKDDKQSIFSTENLCVDFKKMKKGNVLAQFFAIFMPDEETYKVLNVKPMSDVDYFNAMFEVYLKNLKEHADIILPAHCFKDIEENSKKGKMSALLTMEDGRMINGDFDKLEDLYDLGIRALTLTWNNPNCFGFPHSSKQEEMMKGLTRFGKEAVEYMNELGMLIDVSHLSDGGFWDVIKISQKPIAATHSNCREICAHTRNMNDDMIRALGNNGGVMGLNFYPKFLNTDMTDPRGKIDVMIMHLKHMVSVGGIEVAALGSDFDGMNGELEIQNCSECEKLFAAMKKAGFSEGEIDKIAYKNVMRVIKDTMWY